MILEAALVQCIRHGNKRQRHMSSVKNARWLCYHVSRHVLYMSPYVYCWQSSPTLLSAPCSHPGSESDQRRWMLPGAVGPSSDWLVQKICFRPIPCRHAWEYESLSLYKDRRLKFHSCIFVCFFCPDMLQQRHVSPLGLRVNRFYRLSATQKSTSMVTGQHKGQTKQKWKR